MKTTIAIVFILLYGVALVRPAFPIVEYYLKMEVYLEKCANKKRPELKCNGQCILMQKLRAMNIETQDVPRPTPAKINFEDYPIGFVEALRAIRTLPINLNNTFEVVPPLAISGSYKDAIFHPPS